MTPGTRQFLRAGHWPTLAASFLYFDFCLAIWVLNGAMAPFIVESLLLTPAQTGLMLSVPLAAGALIRFPLGVLSQYIGRKNAAMVEMGLIAVGLLYGYFFVERYDQVLAMGILLGVAGASFGVALSLGSGWYPPRFKGLAMGLVGAGNSGTALAVLLAPPLATRMGWSSVYGVAAGFMLIPALVMWFVAKEPPDRVAQSVRQHLACLFERDGWIFSAIYVVSAGGYIGLVSFLPTYFHEQFAVGKVSAGQLTMAVTFMSAVARVYGGHLSDHWGGVNLLSVVLASVCVTLLLCVLCSESLVATALLFTLYFMLLGAGSGSLFQLVPLRWPTTTAIVGSMIGELGTLGGSFVPNAMGQSRQLTGSYGAGFIVCASVAASAFVLLRLVQGQWTSTWVGPGGRALAEASTASSDLKHVVESR